MYLPKDYRPVVRCPNCQKDAAARVVGHYSYALEDVSPGAAEFIIFAKCPDCSQPFLLSRQGEDMEIFGQPETWDDPIVLYPGNPTAMDKAVPPVLAASYLEASRVFAVQAYTSSSIMCRRTLEGICSHFQADGRNLDRKLADLKDKRILDPRLYEWSNEALRALGNEAAHDVQQTVNAQDSKDVLDFTKAILEYLFVFAAAFESFKKRRENRKEGSCPPPEGP